MANNDNPNGFRCIGLFSGGPVPEPMEFTLATSQTITKGDALIMNNNLVQIALSNSGAIHCVSAETKTTTAGATATILAWPADPNYLFEAQCSGTYAAASHLYTLVDIEGATGEMEVNENANTEQVFQVLGHVQNDDNEIGANTRVWGRFMRSTFTPVLAAL